MNSVNFKASLMLGDGNVEIRRFTANADTAKSFALFRHKLQTVFPQLNGIQFTIVWNDEENDDVTIGSDEELSIALFSLSDDLKKIQIYPKQHSAKMDVPLNETEPDRNLFKKIQVNVICDECDSHVVGFRYKCLQCRNYDLCESCEAKHLHSSHIMLRLPETVPHGVCKDLFKKMHASAIHLASTMESGCYKPERSCDFNCDYAKLARKKCKNKHRGSFTCHEYGDMDEHFWEVKEKRKKIPLRKCAGTMYDFSEIYNAFVNPFASRNENESANKTEEFHTSPVASAVEHTFGNILKPFVQAVHQGLMPKTRSENEKGPSTSSHGNKRDNERNLNELVQKLAKKNATHEASETMNEASAPPQEEPTPTHVQPEPENKTNVSPAPTDPKIENALQVMLSMGFTNEEDCLRNILEEMDGDIEKVLECIDNALKL